MSFDFILFHKVHLSPSQLSKRREPQTLHGAERFQRSSRSPQRIGYFERFLLSKGSFCFQNTCITDSVGGTAVSAQMTSFDVKRRRGREEPSGGALAGEPVRAPSGGAISPEVSLCAFYLRLPGCTTFQALPDSKPTSVPPA